MLAASFNTMPLTRRLRDKAKFTQEQAEETASAIAESVAEWQTTINVATKDDIGVVQQNLREVELRLEAKITTTVAECKTEIIKWMFGTIGVQTIVIVGTLLGILRFSGH